ncbi:MAG: 16S rRNA (uracil(1498)-N(3))-methyltransferase [Mariprofundaceae bacterium]|nr:16S rRNA (uracil(1498)-N(3))-methyltransferase [Mariprofundaceae bacterium]
MFRVRNTQPPLQRTPRCRIFLDTALQVGSEAVIPADQAHYLRHVMRMAAGDELTVFDGCGGEYRANLSRLGNRDAACRIEEILNISRELPVAVHIIQCANKSEKIETVLQKGTELGAAGFQIAVSERSQFRLAEQKLESRLQRWRKIIIEAAEQSGRTLVPELSYCNKLHEVETHGRCFAMHPEAATPWQGVRDSLAAAAALTLAIGPEGGFSVKDLAMLQEKGFESMLFGPRVMRTETAAPAMLAAIAAVL